MSRRRGAATTDTSRAPQALLLGAAAAAISTAVWVILTAAADGTTYHLFPLLIGAAAPVAARYVVPSPLPPVEAAIATAFGAVAWIAGWVVLVALDKWPSVTFLADQPGGVEGETIVLGRLGASIGLAYAAYRR